MIFEPRHGPDPLPPARAGTAAERGPEPADLGRAAGHAAAALVDQPGDEDRHLVGRRVGDRPVDDRVLEDPGPPAAGARRGQRGDLGRAHRHAGRAGRRRSCWRRRASRSTRSWSRPATRSTRASSSTRAARSSARAGSSTPPTSGCTSTTSCRCSQPAELAEVVVAKRGNESIRIGDVASVVKDHQALIGDAVIDGGPGLMMIVEKLPVGQHARRHAGRRGRPSTRCGPGSPGSTSTPRSSGRRPSCEEALEQPRRVAGARLACWS